MLHDLFVVLIRWYIEKFVAELIDKSTGLSFETKYNHEMKIGIFMVVFAVLFGGYMVFVAFSNIELYSYFIKEDGIIEYGSAISWFLSAIIVLVHTIKLPKCKIDKNWQLITNIILITFFILCAGEEISWGQRLIGIETPKILKEINVQNELTLHNILSISVFSNLFFLFTVIFFLVIPYLTKKYARIKNVLYFIYFPVSNRFVIYIFLVTLITWIIVGIRFGTLGFHPFSFLAEGYYTQMDDEIFEFFSAFTFLSFSIMHSVKQVRVIKDESVA